MGRMPPYAFDAAILVAAVLSYVLIWIVSRRFSRFAQVLARLMPLALIGPILLVLQAQRGMQPQTAQRPAPQVEERGSPQTVERKLDVPSQPRVQSAPPPAALPPPPAPPPVLGPSEPPRTGEAQPDRSAQMSPPPPPPPVLRAPAPVDAAPPPKAGTAQPGPAPGEPAAREADWDVVPVFYGTDRSATSDARRIKYTSDRGRRLELGRALVTVPKSHQVPHIERPFAIRIPYMKVTLYEAGEDPKQHFTVKEITALSSEDFLHMARERILGSRSFKDQAVVFVHGYNTEFDYALYRSAQMAYDLKFDGATFLYSWPSSGDMTGYVYDRESSEQAEPYLRTFLDMVLRDTGAQSVSVIAHSMGNLPLLRVLQTLGPQLPPDVKLNQIILAAPDVDRDVFANLASTIRPYGHGVTLYCSSNDRAMSVARRVAGGISRAGDVGADGPVVIDGIDTIDVSQTSTEYLALNHSFYAQNSALLNDISLLLQTGERPPEMRIPILQRIATPKGDFWRYPAAR